MEKLEEVHEHCLDIALDYNTHAIFFWTNMSFCLCFRKKIMFVSHESEAKVILSRAKSWWIEPDRKSFIFYPNLFGIFHEMSRLKLEISPGRAEPSRPSFFQFLVATQLEPNAWYVSICQCSLSLKSIQNDQNSFRLKTI